MTAVRSKRRVRPVDYDSQVFTTGAVAEIVRVAPRTVAKWFDSGRLKGYRIPCSLDRRVYREDLIKFLRENGMKVPVQMTGGVRVLLVGLGDHLAGQLGELLPAADGFRLEAVEGLFDAGLAAHEFCPAAVVVDGSVGRVEMARMATGLRANGTAGSRLVAVVGEDVGADTEGTAGYDDVFVRPVDPAALAGLIRAGREG